MHYACNTKLAIFIFVGVFQYFAVMKTIFTFSSCIILLLMMMMRKMVNIATINRNEDEIKCLQWPAAWDFKCSQFILWIICFSFPHFLVCSRSIEYCVSYFHLSLNIFSTTNFTFWMRKITFTNSNNMRMECETEK